MSTLSALDIQRWLHEDASPREWRMSEVEQADGAIAVQLYAESDFIGLLTGPRARQNADLIIRMRNTLPEHIRNFEHLRAQIRLLEAEIVRLKNS